MADENASQHGAVKIARRDETTMQGQLDDPGLAGSASNTPEGVADSLDRLSAGALRWLRQNLGFFDPYSASSELPAVPKAKATLELALLCHYWARVKPGDEGLGEVTALIQRIWECPDFPQVLATAQGYARQYALIYGALAPAGITGGLYQATLAQLTADGYIGPLGKSPYLRLETRYYADLARVGHGIESYEELYESSLLADRAVALPVTHSDAYTITHTIFYLTDFGFRNPGLPRDHRERVHRIVCQLTDYSVQHDEWDLVGEYILAQFCLGGDPIRTPSGAAGIQRLVQAQLPNGAIPGRSVARKARKSATDVEFFRKAYHTTLVSALVSLIISSVPPNS